MALLELFKSFTRGQENAQDQLNANFAALEGAVIVEIGDNENGNWIKFGNGFMICWKTRIDGNGPITTQTGSNFRNQSKTWEYPQLFTDIPSCVFTVDSGAGFAWSGMGSVTTDAKNASFIILSSTSNGSTGRANGIAIGPWK